jgi:hypothetical protein
MKTALRTVATAKADEFIGQQDTCTPWGLHYIAYQDTYYALPAQPTRRSPLKPARKLTTTAS